MSYRIGQTITHKTIKYTVAGVYEDKGFIRVRTQSYPTQMMDIDIKDLEEDRPLPKPKVKPRGHTGIILNEFEGYEWGKKTKNYECLADLWRKAGRDWNGILTTVDPTKQLELPTTQKGAPYYDTNELLNEEPAQAGGEEEMEAEKVQATDPYAGLFGGVIEEARKRVEKAVDEKMDGELADLRKAIKEKQTLEIKMGEVKGEIQGTRHYQLPELLKLAGLRLPTLLIGMAGTGKTHAAEQVAEGLGLEFYAMSVGAQTSKSDIVGYMNANGVYVGTHFRTAYEKGGVFLMDEIDAGNANVLIQINAALSNGKAAFPDKMVKAHEDFVFIASANTYGTGANRQYVGRNQLDAATLDRFTVLNWGIDVELEQKLAGDNSNWYAAVTAARDKIAREQIRALITPRATVRGAKLLATGMELNEVIDAALLGTVPDDKKQMIKEAALLAYSGGKPRVGGKKVSSMIGAEVAF